MNEHTSQRYLSEAPVKLPENRSEAEYYSDAMVDLLNRFRHRLRLPAAGLELPRAARLARELRPQPQAQDRAGDARADRGVDGARLCQGDRPRRRVHPARPGRADERIDGRLQRVRRPRAGAGARRLRSARPRRPPLDRLAALRVDPERHRQEIREVVGGADHAAMASRRHRAGAQDRADGAARAGLCHARLRHPGAEDQRRADVSRRQVLPAGTAGRRQSGRAGAGRRRAAQRRAPGDRRRTLRHQSRRHQAAGRADRAHGRRLSR